MLWRPAGRAQLACLRSYPRGATLAGVFVDAHYFFCRLCHGCERPCSIYMGASRLILLPASVGRRSTWAATYAKTLAGWRPSQFSLQLALRAATMVYYATAAAAAAAAAALQQQQQQPYQVPGRHRCFILVVLGEFFPGGFYRPQTGGIQYTN